MAICYHWETELNVDHTIPDSEVNLRGYYIFWYGRNRSAGSVAYYIRKDLCFNTRIQHCQEIENLAFDILLPKSKLITIGVFYRPPNKADFTDLVIKKIMRYIFFVILTISFKTAITF